MEGIKELKKSEVKEYRPQLPYPSRFKLEQKKAYAYSPPKPTHDILLPPSTSKKLISKLIIEQCSAITKERLPPKCKYPGSFEILIAIESTSFKALCD